MNIAHVQMGHIPVPPNGWGAIEKIQWKLKTYMENQGHTVSLPYINDVQPNQYDIVHVHVWNHAVELQSRGIPYMFTCHDHHAFIHGKDSDVYKNNYSVMQNSIKSFVPAKYLVDYFNGVPTYLRHGVDTVEFSTGNQLEDSQKKLLVVGNNGVIGDQTFDRKGFRFAIEAANKLRMPITIVGPTNSNKAFFDANSDLLGENVTVLYDLTEEQLISTYRSHHILIHPTSVEAGHPPLTILEAAACGLVVLEHNCSGELYTIPIKRDADDIADKIRDTLSMYELNRAKTMYSIGTFEWADVVDDLLSYYEDPIETNMRSSILSVYNNVYKRTVDNRIVVNFNDGPFVEILGNKSENYTIDFIDGNTNEIIYTSHITNNQWSRASRRWHTDWIIRIYDSNGASKYEFDATDKNVNIIFESSSLGDTIAWIPYVEEFRLKHKCNVSVVTYWNDMLAPGYPDVKFIKPGDSLAAAYATYRLGIFYDDVTFDAMKHKTNFLELSLQEIACDMLGLKYVEIKPNIQATSAKNAQVQKYICIANHSTAQAKYWNNSQGWQQVVDYVKTLGYDVYLLSREPDGYMGNKNPTGVVHIKDKRIDEIADILSGCDLFIGIGTGLSWLAWALDVPTILISGFSKPYQEMSTVTRIINDTVCNGCFARHYFDRGNWNWCPDHAGTPRQFECTKLISFDDVKPHIDNHLLNPDLVIL